MGRADRRRLMREQLKKSQDLKEKYDQNTLMERLTQNGISPNDLKTSYKEGFDEGLKVAARPILPAVCSSSVSRADRLPEFVILCKNVL